MRCLRRALPTLFLSHAKALQAQRKKRAIAFWRVSSDRFFYLTQRRKDAEEEEGDRTSLLLL
jgi:hypothetical protein